MIEAAYRKFWQQYARKFGKHWFVIIGKSHNDATPALRQVAMEWKPLERMVYSDCFGNSQAYLLVEPEKNPKTKEGSK
jgi:hypothetical protein